MGLPTDVFVLIELETYFHAQITGVAPLSFDVVFVSGTQKKSDGARARVMKLSGILFNYSLLHSKNLRVEIDY